MAGRLIVVTGAAGFIGFHVAQALLERGDTVVGLDNLNDYYPVELKEARLAILKEQRGFIFRRVNVADRRALGDAFDEVRPSLVIHLAAQAGVRHSIDNPGNYVDSNLVGFGNVLEACRDLKIAHLVYASSSSVYGLNGAIPFSVHDNVDHPVSLYAATKKANELMAHAYSHLFGLPTTGLRFFTVYGPWGRPDMALFKFTKAILEGSAIDVYNRGDMRRDFTYIDDVVEGILRVLDRPAAANPEWNASAPDPGSSRAPYRVYNIGRGAPVPLGQFIELLEETIGRKAEKKLLPMQAGDVLETFADVEDLKRDTGFNPSTPIEVGVPRFVEWYRSYYKT
jgi:UDP-glucuronate 4-epimerase